MFIRTTAGRKGKSVLKATIPTTLPRKWAGITTIMFVGDIRPANKMINPK
jgi:hypothetical protein